MLQTSCEWYAARRPRFQRLPRRPQLKGLPHLLQVAAITQYRLAPPLPKRKQPRPPPFPKGNTTATKAQAVLESTKL